MKALLIGLAGAAGALCRYGIGVAVKNSATGETVFAHIGLATFATMGINVAGSFVLGFTLTAMAAGRISPTLGAVIGIGFCGAFTTFSTLMWDSFALGRHSHLYGAAFNIGISVALGLLAAGAGYGIARAVYA